MKRTSYANQAKRQVMAKINPIPLIKSLSRRRQLLKSYRLSAQISSGSAFCIDAESIQKPEHVLKNEEICFLSPKQKRQKNGKETTSERKKHIAFFYIETSAASIFIDAHRV